MKMIVDTQTARVNEARRLVASTHESQNASLGDMTSFVRSAVAQRSS